MADEGPMGLKRGGLGRGGSSRGSVLVQHCWIKLVGAVACGCAPVHACVYKRGGAYRCMSVHADACRCMHVSRCVRAYVHASTCWSAPVGADTCGYDMLQDRVPFAFHTFFGHISYQLHTNFCIAWLPLVT